ncbi:hypothetical protein H0H81_008243, partial [Sphagnurus paluster]
AQALARQTDRDERTLDEPARRRIPQYQYQNLPPHLAQAYAALPPLNPLAPPPAIFHPPPPPPQLLTLHVPTAHQNLPAHLAQAYAALPPLIPPRNALPLPPPVPSRGRGRGRGRSRFILPPLPALHQYQNLPAHLAQQAAH